MRRLLRQDDGAAAVELAFLLPLLVMLAFGIIQFGTAYNRQQGMQAAVREGARLAASSFGSDVVTASDIEVRVENSLQRNAGGSGYPAAGGTDDLAQVQADVVVEVTNLTSPTDTTSAVLSSGDNVCDGAHSVRVVAYIVEARRDEYGLVLPLIQGSPFELPMAAEGIFRCLG